MFIFHEREFDLFKLFDGQSPKIRVRVFPVFDCDQKLQNKLKITLKRKKDNRTKMPVNKKVIIFKEQKIILQVLCSPKVNRPNSLGV